MFHAILIPNHGCPKKNSFCLINLALNKGFAVKISKNYFYHLLFLFFLLINPVFAADEAQGIFTVDMRKVLNAYLAIPNVTDQIIGTLTALLPQTKGLPTHGNPAIVNDSNRDEMNKMQDRLREMAKLSGKFANQCETVIKSAIQSVAKKFHAQIVFNTSTNLNPQMLLLAQVHKKAGVASETQNMPSGHFPPGSFGQPFTPPPFAMSPMMGMNPSWFSQSIVYSNDLTDEVIKLLLQESAKK